MTRWLPVGVALIVGCTAPQTPPWRLMELGHGDVTSALDAGQWVLAESEAGPGWLSPDTTLEGRALLRDLRSLPTLACGDRMRLSPTDLPWTLRDRFGWTGTDSLTVHWQCLGPDELAQHHTAAMRRRPFDQGRIEADWVALLRAAEPDWMLEGQTPIAEGDSVTLTISTRRADGITLEPDPVVLTFALGHPDQVVPALAPWLSGIKRGTQFAVWSTSDQAFGSEAHPELGLPEQMPLRFSVRVD